MVENLNLTEQEPSRNVGATVLFVRHGQRDKTNKLTDLGAQQARKAAKRSGLDASQYRYITALGSPVDPPAGDAIETIAYEPRSGRARRTAELMVEELTGEPATSFPNVGLNYKSLKTPPPYDHPKVYNAALPADYGDLTDEQKVRADDVAEAAVVKHLLSLTGDQAETFRRESAGAYATALLRLIELVRQGLPSDTASLFVAGCHGIHMGLLLRYALVREYADGRRVVGFEDIDEIGGTFRTAESYEVHVRTNREGKLEPMEVSFPNRSLPGEQPVRTYLDLPQLIRLANFYGAIQGMGREYRKDEFV